MEEIRSEELHAGDWVLDPDGKPVWVAVRGRVDPLGNRRFLMGRGSATVANDVTWSPDHPVTLLSRWPELPGGVKIQ